MISVSEIAEKLQISKMIVYRFINRYAHIMGRVRTY